MASISRRLAVTFVAILFAQLDLTAASTVRGRLERINSKGQTYAVSGIGVTLNHQKRGRSSTAYSGSDGMYYLHNIAPGPYTLEVWVNKSKPLTYQIQVRDQPYTDIAPIRIP